MVSTGADHGSGATSPDGKRIVVTLGNESNIGDLPLAVPAPSRGMNGSDDPPHEVTPSDDYGCQACDIAEAVALSLASSMTVPASLRPTRGSGGRRKTVEVTPPRWWIEGVWGRGARAEAPTFAGASVPWSESRYISATS